MHRCLKAIGASIPMIGARSIALLFRDCGVRAPKAPIVLTPLPQCLEHVAALLCEAIAKPSPPSVLSVHLGGSIEYVSSYCVTYDGRRLPDRPPVIPTGDK